MEFKWVSIRDIVHDMYVNFSPGQTLCRIGRSAEILTSQSLVWYNPGSFALLEDELSDAAVADGRGSFEVQQYKAVLEFLELWLCDNCRIIESPQTQRRFSNKLLQLHTIARVFPDNLIETELISKPAQLRPGILVKHLGESRMMTKDEAFYAQELSDVQISALSDGPWTPLLAQRPIAATEEFRTFVFGRETATIRLPRPALEGQIYDIQFFPDCVVRAAPVDSVINQGFWDSLGASMGISIFAVDYVMQHSIPKIFEINPVFSWSWLPGACIDAVAEATRRYFAK
jgi:hypothetical protein